MKLTIDTQKMNVSGAELLNASRTTRRLRLEIEDVRRQLAVLSQMDQCRAELMKQEDALALVTARLTNLSTALDQIAGAYDAAERRNGGDLEERGGIRGNYAQTEAYETDGSFRERINHVLFK